MFRFDFPEFVPSRLLPGGHAQTILGSFLPGPGEPNGSILRFVDTTLGDQLALKQNQPASCAAVTHQVILLHGLAGCHRSGYMTRTCHRLLDRGFGVYRMDARGAGAGLELARYHHHAGRSEDLESAVNFVANEHPNSRIILVGFSLGANVLLHYLGATLSRTHQRVDAAIAVAPPIDLSKCSIELKTGLSRGYDAYFARVMLERLKERRRARPDMVDYPLRNAPKTLRQFDAQFTARAGGFSSIEDYYSQASSGQYLSRIHTPTLIFVDEDDPVIPIALFDEVSVGPNTHLIRTRGGGHLGYFAKRNIDPDRHWMSWRIAEAVEQFSRTWVSQPTTESGDE